MPDRVSLIEQYDNRDVIAQIYRIIDIAEHGAIETLTATKEGAVVKLIFTMHDGTKHEITFEANGVKDVYAVQSGSTETVHVVLDDDTDKTFTFDIAIAGVTTDTQQTITARKTFTAPQTFSGGIEGTTMIDGDVQVSNGHSLSVAGDIDTAGDMQVAGNAEFLGNVEAGGMAIEESNGRTILSNSNGIIMDGQLTLDSMSVGDMSAGGMSIRMSGDGSTVLNSANGISIGQSVKVPTSATGTRSDDAVNGIRLQNDLDNYGPMVRNTGNHTLYGNYTFENNIAIAKINPKMVFRDTREYSELTNANILGGHNIFVSNNGEIVPLNTNEVRVSGFGVPRGVENMIYTHCYTEENEQLTAILRVRLNPTTKKAQLLFGTNIISEVDL